MNYNKLFLFIILLAGFFLGWLVFSPHKKTVDEHNHAEESVVSEIWTCAMHPQIRMDKPGKCPICGMDLIPLSQSVSASLDSGAVKLSKEAVHLAEIMTTPVSGFNPVREVRLYGEVIADERLISNQTAHVSGRIEKLYVSFTGETVKEGQLLAQVYSPELVSAQKELLEAGKIKQTRPSIYQAAREKLMYWKLTDKQIDMIEESGTVQPLVDVVSTTGGVVVSKMVNTGDYISQGAVLYRVADLSKVWIMFDAYESDIPFIKRNDKVSFMLQSFPGKEFAGSITFIDPVVDPVTRVARVRAEANNRTGQLKPGMFVTGIVHSSLPEYSKSLAIPKSAVLWTGKRSVVYVKQAGMDEPVFKMREVVLGPLLGDYYVVEEGLNAGEEVVTSGTFAVDAAAQLQGKPSMMNPAGGVAPTGHIHGTMKEMADMQEMTEMKTMNNLAHETFNVSGNCEMCKERIETAAKSVKGVMSALWDIDTKILHLEYDKKITSSDAVLRAVADAGHDNEKYRADDEVYNKLPECCLYRK